MITSASLLEALETAKEKGYDLDVPVEFLYSNSNGIIKCRSTINTIEIHPDRIALWQSDSHDHDSIFLLD
jgi:hypothetical protein